MIAQSYNMMLQSSTSSASSYSFNIGQNVDLTPLGHVSVSQIIFPKNIYQITSQFTLTIDSTVITFNPGNITFSGLISKLQKALGSGYQVIEYLSDSQQQSAKLSITRTATGNITITLSNPTYAAFFGNLPTGVNPVISQNIVNLSNNTLIVVRSNLVSSLVPQFNHSDVLYSFSVDNSINYGYVQLDNIDIIQNKQPLIRQRQFNISFEDQNGNALTFQNNSAFFIRITLFHYKLHFIDYIQSNLQKLLGAFILKNFKKDLQDNENEETVQDMDINAEFQRLQMQLKMSSDIRQ